MLSRGFLAFTVLILISCPADAANPWVWSVQGQAPTFATKAEAVAHMHSLTHIDPRYPQLTVQRRAERR